MVWAVKLLFSLAQLECFSDFLPCIADTSTLNVIITFQEVSDFLEFPSIVFRKTVSGSKVLSGLSDSAVVTVSICTSATVLDKHLDV